MVQSTSSSSSPNIVINYCFAFSLNSSGARDASQIACLIQFLIDPSPCLLQEHLPDLSRRQVHPQVSLLMMSSVTRMCKCNQSNQLRNEIAALRNAPFFNFSSSLNVSRMEAIHHSFNHRMLKHCRTPSLKVMRQEGNPSRMEEIYINYRINFELK